MAAIALLVIFPLGQSYASGPKTITLKASHLGPTTEAFHLAIEQFAKVIGERTNGGIKIDIFPAGSLLKGTATLEGTGKGLADLGFVSFAYTPGELPFSSNAQMIPFGWDWSTVRQILEAGRPLFQEEVGKFNQTLLFPNPLVGIWFLKKPIDVDNPSLKGWRVRTPGGTMRLFTEALGGAVVSMSSAEIAGAIRTGMVDGFWTSLDAYMAYEFFDVAPYVYDTGPGNMFSGIWWTINNDTWKKLPIPWQMEIVRAADDTTDWYLEMMKTRDKKHFEKAESKGAKITHLTKAQIEVWKAKVRPTIEEKLIKDHGEKMRKWIETVDKIAAGK